MASITGNESRLSHLLVGWHKLNARGVDDIDADN
jgi:hypothetical protein